MAVGQTQLIIDWLTSLGWDTTEESGYPLVPGSYIRPSPDRIVHITGSGGPGYLLEGAVDSSLFQVRLRGPQDSFGATERAAQDIDALIYGARFPAIVDGVTITLVTRFGSGMTPLPLDPSDLRYEFTCNYTINTGVS